MIFRVKSFWIGIKDPRYTCPTLNHNSLGIFQFDTG